VSAGRKRLRVPEAGFSGKVGPPWGNWYERRLMSTAPHFEIDVADFWRDPYPALARMRREAPIAFVPQLGSTLLTRRDDIFVSEKRIDVFSSDQPAGLMTRLMGHNMMRKDGDAHMAERSIFFPAVSPKAVRAHWRAEFQTACGSAFSIRSAGQGAPTCWRNSRCRCRANASSRSPA
jgi:cytochrome P450